MDRCTDENELFAPWAEPGEYRAQSYNVWNQETKTSTNLVPRTIQEYRAAPAEWSHIVGIIDKGTELRVDKVVLRRTHDSSRFYFIATLLTGPYSGSAVLLNPVSQRESRTEALRIDYRYLHQATRKKDKATDARGH